MHKVSVCNYNMYISMNKNNCYSKNNNKAKLIVRKCCEELRLYKKKLSPDATFHS